MERQRRRIIRLIGFGPAGMTPGTDGEKVRDAVTVTVAKKKGMNASDVAQTALQTIY